MILIRTLEYLWILNFLLTFISIIYLIVQLAVHYVPPCTFYRFYFVTWNKIVMCTRKWRVPSFGRIIDVTPVGGSAGQAGTYPRWARIRLETHRNTKKLVTDEVHTRAGVPDNVVTTMQCGDGRKLSWNMNVIKLDNRPSRKNISINF